jgi:hypothetical protein
LLPQDETAWLLAIGKRLRREYEAGAEPLPRRLAELMRQIEKLGQESSPKLQKPGNPPSRFRRLAPDNLP